MTPPSSSSPVWPEASANRYSQCLLLFSNVLCFSAMFSTFQQWWQWCDNDDDDHDNDNEEGGWCGERGAQDQRRQHDNHSLELTTTTSVQSVQCKVLWLSKASVCLFCRGAINQLSQSVSSHDQSINLPERNLSSLSIGYQYYVHTTLSALTSAIN